MKEQILSKLSAECPWRDTLHWFESIDSTNDEAKRMAKNGAPHGTVLIAGQQSGGRGRMGRSFQSPTGMGVYLSVILRPGCKPQELMHLTCVAGVAMCNAVSALTGQRPGIKWTNDLILQKRKLGGILTELSIDPKTGLTEYAIIGIGINCCQYTEDFPPELQSIATSLSMAGVPVQPSDLAAAMICALADMDGSLFAEKAVWMQIYRTDCVTLGQQIAVVLAQSVRHGKAVDVDDNGGLVVAFDDGQTETVTSGEVSIRGMYGYV